MFKLQLNTLLLKSPTEIWHFVIYFKLKWIWWVEEPLFHDMNITNLNEKKVIYDGNMT
jgi:hypothetical protein